MFLELVSNLSKFNAELTETIVNSMQSNSAEICDLNTDQLSKGQYIEGGLISPELRRPSYAENKKKKGGKAPEGVPDLKDTGDFYSGWYTKPVKDGLEIGSKDEKSDDLERKYADSSSNIFGIPDKDKETIGEYVIKDLQNEFEKITDI